MRGAVSRCSLVLALLPVPRTATAAPIDLYVMAGQSNMSGWGETAELDGVNASPQADVLYHVQGGGFGALRPTDNQFGPELSFGRTMGDDAVAPLAIVKHAKGSTSLAADWSPREGVLYGQLIDRVAMGRSYWAALGYDTRIAGIVWVQGEADARVHAMATAYDANLRAFIAALRSDLGAPQAPFVLGQIRGKDFPFRDIVRAAQYNVDAAGLNAHLVESDDLTTFEGLHFDTASQLELGRRYATAMLGARSMIEGDVNADGVVDLNDVNAVRTNFGSAGPGDATRDGRIDLADLNVVRNHFGASASTAVPAPATWRLLGIGFSMLWCVRRRVTNCTRSRANRPASGRSRNCPGERAGSCCT